MEITELYKAKLLRYSIEVFPPKNGCSLDSLLATIESLNSFRPAFVSVTYGALGNARGGTVEIASMVKKRYGLETIANITAVNKSKQDIENLLVGASYCGIENVLALRGDPEQGKRFEKHKEGHEYAYQLVEQIKAMNEGRYLHGTGEKTRFAIGVACYPEGHKDNPKKESEAMHLKMKQDAGADFAITQMIFDNEKYFEFIEQSKALGVTIPIIPGIMPIRSLNSVHYFKDTFGVTVPEQLIGCLESFKGNKKSMEEAGTNYAAKQAKELLEKGTQGIHFYTMNRAETIKKVICSIRQ